MNNFIYGSGFCILFKYSFSTLRSQRYPIFFFLIFSSETVKFFLFKFMSFEHLEFICSIWCEVAI